MKKALCFGELLLRFSPQLQGAWVKQYSMPVYVGGAELNAATALAKWDIPVAYATVLPDNYLSKEIIDEIKNRGIDTSTIQFEGERIGSYILPQGADLKNAGVIYDRKYSSFWELKKDSFDWDALFEGFDWFHFSAITPALNANLAAITLEAVQKAKKKGLTVSIDLNYRAKLWQYGKQPADIMPALVEHCDIVMGNIWAEEKMLGVQLKKELGSEKQELLDESRCVSEMIMTQFQQCKQVANTFRFDKGSGIDYYATLFTNGTLYQSPAFSTEKIIDKVGSGDTFMAGLIYGNINEQPPQEIIDFAAAAAFNKLFIVGDASTASVGEIKNRSHV
jgi:2-dehydro-3-deoxygluconokinase